MPAVQMVRYSPNANETYQAKVTSGDPTNTASKLTLQYTDAYGNLQTVKNVSHQVAAPAASYSAPYWI